MLDHIVKLFDRPLYALLGGTHLVESSPESLKMSLDYLDNSSLKKIGASHCTGQEVIQQLATSSSRFFNNCTGSSLVIG
jgi:7,8-dihydropterin-6-yl-methyl-4-(beta-D-ribofuranosyl)aminobenzene 5'-phosphate synthase